MRKKFWEIARLILIEEKGPNLREFGHVLGLEYATLYARLNGRTPFRLDEACALLGKLPDRRLADALLQDTSFIAIPRLGESGWGGTEDVIDLALQSALRLLEVLRSINQAKAGHHIDRAGRSKIESHVHEAERALANLRLTIPHLSVSGVPSGLPG